MSHLEDLDGHFKLDSKRKEVGGLVSSAPLAEQEVFSQNGSAQFRKFQRSSCASSLQTWKHRTACHLTATRVMSELCANVMRGVGGVIRKESAHWSVSHSLISHHRTAAIKQSTGLVGSLWSTCAACGETGYKSPYTSFVCHYSFKLTLGKQNCV
jgi:hypothetical protein